MDAKRWKTYPSGCGRRSRSSSSTRPCLRRKTRVSTDGRVQRSRRSSCVVRRRNDRGAAPATLWLGAGLAVEGADETDGTDLHRFFVFGETLQFSEIIMSPRKVARLPGRTTPGG